MGRAVRKDKNPRESDIEAYLVEQVAAMGGVAEKFKSPQKAHVPDRIVSWPRTASYEAEVHFVELKAPGKNPTVMQARDHERRLAMGHQVFVIDSYEGVDSYIRENA
jgi:hypothetical protein